jgi:DNA polymerase-3 subunit delta'
MKSAGELDAALDEWRRDAAAAAADAGAAPATGRGKKGKAAKAADPEEAPEATPEARRDATPEATPEATPDEAATPKVAAADRRSAAATLVAIWASVARDLAVARAGGARSIREMELVDELPAIAPAVSPGTLASFLAQLAVIDRQLDENVNPELALDVLALSWPRIEPRVGRAATAAPAAGPAGRRR